MVDTTDYLFTVLEGESAGTQIALSGRSMPYRAGAGGSISYGGEQRTKLTWYQGNPTATQHVFGPTLEPTLINGVWRDRYLGDGQSEALRLQFDDLRKQGVQLRVEWEGFVRQGLIKRLVAYPGDPVGGSGDMRWEMLLEWNSEGGQRRRPVVAPSTSESLRDGIGSVALGMNTLQNLVQTAIDKVLFVGAAIGMFDATKNQLSDILGSGTSAVATLAQSASRMASDDTLSGQTARDAAAAMGRVSVDAAEFARIFGDSFAGQSTVSDDVPSLLSAAISRADVVDEAYSVLGQVFDQRVKLEQVVRPLAFKEVRPPTGTDLRAVSLVFFGTPDEWQKIAAANGLDASLVPPDVVSILVPLAVTSALDSNETGIEAVT